MMAWSPWRSNRSWGMLDHNERGRSSPRQETVTKRREQQSARSGTSYSNSPVLPVTSEHKTSLQEVLTNSAIAELLAKEAETAKQPLQKALRRASRRAFLWPEEAAQLVIEGRSLEEELPGVGPYLGGVIRHWIQNPPLMPEPPDIRADFLTVPEARSILAKNPSWRRHLKGDLQMHTQWSDGSGSIEQMAEAAAGRGYEFIAITDHSKGLKIAGGIDCYPDRQDLNVELLKVAKAAGCRISLGTDSHDPSQLGFIDLGLAAALWSGIQPERILNFMPLNQLSKWIANIR